MPIDGNAGIALLGKREGKGEEEREKGSEGERESERGKERIRKEGRE